MPKALDTESERERAFSEVRTINTDSLLHPAAPLRVSLACGARLSAKPCGVIPLHELHSARASPFVLTYLFGRLPAAPARTSLRGRARSVPPRGSACLCVRMSRRIQGGKGE